MTNDARIHKGIERGQPFELTINGKTVTGYPGETIATILMAEGWTMFRHSAISGEPRGMFCGMGLCYDCLVKLNGMENVRACVTYAQPGDQIERQLS